MKSSTEHWWTWNWDDSNAKGDLAIKYSSIMRWRRGWITLYRMESENEAEWLLYLPFNLYVGISFWKD